VTGAATLIGPIGFNPSGLSFAPAAGVTVTQSGGSTNVTEGGATDSYTVALNTAPTANVTITINPGTQLTVAPATLTFTPANFSTPQTVTVTAIDDAVVEGPQVATITHTAASADPAYNAIAVPSITVNITDNDGSPLYGITLGNQLITINTTTGVGTLVGPLNPAMAAWGIAFRGSKLYTYDGTADRIRELDPATAATLNI